MSGRWAWWLAGGLVWAGCEAQADRRITSAEVESYCDRYCSLREVCGEADGAVCGRACRAEFPSGLEDIPGLGKHLYSPALFAWLSCREMSGCGGGEECLRETFEVMGSAELVWACESQLASCPWRAERGLCDALGLSQPSAREAAEACMEPSCPRLEEGAEACVRAAIVGVEVEES